MIGVVFAHVFDAKVVKDEQKNDVFGWVFPKRADLVFHTTGPSCMERQGEFD